MFFLHPHAAIDLDDLTAYITTEVRGKEECDRGYVIGRTASAEGNTCGPLIAYCLWHLEGHFGKYEPWGNNIGTNATASDFLRDALREADHAGF